MNYCLKIKDLLSQQAILEDEDNNLIYLPLKKLPNNLNIGQSLNLQINLETNNKISPKEIINELLGVKSNN
jgi:hypothetical protein